MSGHTRINPESSDVPLPDETTGAAAVTADLSVLLDQLKKLAEGEPAGMRPVIIALAEVAQAADTVRKDIGLTVYDGTPVSVRSGKRHEERLGTALARLRRVLAGEEE